jgi:hypothetical protein
MMKTEGLTAARVGTRERAARMRAELQERLERLRWESRERMIALRAGIEARRKAMIEARTGRSANGTATARESMAASPFTPSRLTFPAIRDPGATLAPPKIVPPGETAAPDETVAPAMPIIGAAGDNFSETVEGTLFSSGITPPPLPAAPTDAPEANPVGELVADLLDRINGDRIELTDEERRAVRKRLYKWTKSSTPDEVETALAEVMTSQTIPPLLRERLIKAATDEVHPSLVKAAQAAVRSKIFRRAIGKTRVGKFLPLLMKLVPGER